LRTGCIILAGGQGRRLGREKAWVELGGKSLLQRAISNLEFLNSEIIIVKAPEGKLPPVSVGVNLKVVQDSVGGKGPLAGILSGLVNSKYCYNLIVACDMALMNKDVVKYMLSIAKGYDAVVPRLGKHLEPLQAVYSKDCISEIEKLLAQNNRLKVAGLFSQVRTRFVESVEIERFDAAHLSFLNINTPTDLKKAEGLLERC
jgi:molybdopterin-guanine dinucleotide biosynthesis protein A